LRRIQRNSLYILFYFADEMYNTYANKKLLLILLQKHFPKISGFLEKMVKSVGDSYLEREEFEAMLPQISDELTKNDIKDLAIVLSTPDLNGFCERIKEN
jgi:hypothetical protein